ncbi:uncharacterized protein BP01DRAFT_423441 [Aspergillus saccharolyticus JOP 1030-1]|uniref:Uncharacterized protein n=1 Tax=Aspergillus saccharolyticus JOP 1030-1 TaxID=1450539 RepID=A0A318ZF02_9EURO|nr:hypothetical protein BP01DRAFT_423441 [Aspergillus saccharolyticus JOP 1030-1]PYH45257.1 hypothetical protein BP01DRAFT_423441 [Aspergillus saccharolyticus JOP 1030-1]
MASCPGKAQDSSPQASLEISNLEIRNTWTGNFEDPVVARVSLEAQILNTRHSDISLVNTSVTRVHSHHFGQSDGLKYEDRPPSPLFAFSSSVTEVSDIGEEPTLDPDKSPQSMEHEASGAHSPNSAESSSRGPCVGDTDRSDSTSPQSARPRTTRLRTTSLQTDCHRAVTPSTTSTESLAFRLNIARSQGWNLSQNLGKRSAADACLPSSASDTESEKDGKKAAGRDNTSHSAPSSGLVYRSKTLARSPQHGRMQRSRSKLSRSYCSNRSSQSSKSKSAPTIGDPVEQARSDSSPEPGLCSSSYIEVAGNDLSNTTSSFVDIEQDAVSVVSPATEQPTFVSDSISSAKDLGVLEKSLWEHESWRHKECRADVHRISDGSDQEHTHDPETVAVPLGKKQQPFLGGTDGAADTENMSDCVDNDETPKVPSLPGLSSEHGGMIAESQSPEGSPNPCPVKSEASKPLNLDDPTESPEIPSRSSLQEVFGEPRLTLVDGILFLESPPNITPVPYKVVLTMTITLGKGTPSGWSYLIIPGLPRLRKGEDGILLFQMPANHGLEFRITNLSRYHMLEDCFAAEFVYHGDLVVPFRRCNQKFYGVLKGFTVEQEIMTEIIPCPGVTNSTADLLTDICIRYHAFCSVKLHNRCFCAEKCCILLAIDGGPEGSFRIEADTWETGLLVIQLMPETDTPLGTSTLKLICSPKDYAMFCINWTVRLSPAKAISWLPRIYPGSSGSNDRVNHYLRHTHLDNGVIIFARNAVNCEPEASPTRSASGQPGDSEASLPTEEQSLEHMPMESATPTLSSESHNKDVLSTCGEASPNTIGEVTDLEAVPKEFGKAVDEETNSQRDTNANTHGAGQSASLATRGLALLFCAGFAVGIMFAFASVWLSTSYMKALSYPIQDLSRPPVPEEGCLNCTGDMSYLTEDEDHFQQGFEPENTELLAWEYSIPKELSEQESISVQVELEEVEPEAEVRWKEQQPVHSPQVRSFRDRVDYWLGWRGPINPVGDQV